MENNQLINRINNLIMTEDRFEENDISLDKFITFVNWINNQKRKKLKEILKKTNNKLGKNFAFFDYRATAISYQDNIELTLEYNVVKEKVIISKDFKINSKIKNADLLLNLLLDEFKELIATFDNYNLGKLKIKFSYDDLNILINKEQIEVSAYKSPHWITMGSAFVLVYNFMTAKFEYKVDHIDLETSLKNQELLLFKKISFKDDLLDSNIKKLYAESLIISDHPKESLLTKIKLFLTKRMK